MKWNKKENKKPQKDNNKKYHSGILFFIEIANNPINTNKRENGIIKLVIMNPKISLPIMSHKKGLAPQFITVL